MKIVTDIKEWQAIRQNLNTQSIGFVPTMGNLHAGHRSLLTRARAENEILVASIFINPTQFNEPSDYDAYPRTLEQDQTLLLEHRVDYVLLFEKESLYPDHYELRLNDFSGMSDCLEGEYRPSHFAGVLTIVLKLFNIVRPQRAYFGEKDYQQLILIQKMAKALFLEIEVIACSTIRAADGLALSSRNNRLSPEQRAQAALIPKLLNSNESLESILQTFIETGFKVDYIAEKWGRRLVAVWLDKVRLIDNRPLA
jgi:pantoate--beta-alanine ligase